MLKVDIALSTPNTVFGERKQKGKTDVGKKKVLLLYLDQIIMIKVLVIIDRTRLADLIDAATWLSQCDENCVHPLLYTVLMFTR